MISQLLHSYLTTFILGCYFISIAVFMSIKGKYYQILLINLSKDYAVVFLTATLAILIGLILIILHNEWVLVFDVLLVTLLGWYLLISGILWIVLPDQMAHYSRWWYAGFGYYVLMFILAIIGIFFILKSIYLYNGLSFFNI